MAAAAVYSSAPSVHSCRIALPAIVKIILLACFAERTLAGDATWSSASSSVQQGANLTLTCTISGVSAFDIVRLERTAGGATLRLADGEFVKDVFKDTGRYSARLQLDSNTASLTLSYKGIRGEDAGRIGCYKLGDEANTAFTDLEVLVPVKEVIVYKINENSQSEVVEENNEIIIRNGIVQGIRCMAVVDGSTAIPSLKVMIGNSDVTSMFSADHEGVRSVNLSPDKPLGPVRSETALKYTSTNFDNSYNGKTLDCQASIAGFEPVSSKRVIKVEFGPVISCPKYEHYSKMGGSVSFTCTVTANPQSTIVWQWGNGNGGELPSPGVSETMEASENVLSPDTKEVTFHIKSLDLAHLTNYILKAENSLNTKEVSINVREASEEKPPVNPVIGTGDVIGANGASIKVFPSILSFLITFTSIFLTRVLSTNLC